MTSAERLDRWWALLRPKLLELSEEGLEPGFVADWVATGKGRVGMPTHIRYSVTIPTRSDRERYGLSDPAEALEGFL